jgi:hypothetical protein
MDNNDLLVISADRNQLPGQMEFNYIDRFSGEAEIISDAIWLWGKLVAASGLNAYADSFKFSHTGFVCCLAWARVTNLIEEDLTDEILQHYFQRYRDFEILSHIEFDSEMHQKQYERDVDCFEHGYRKECFEAENRRDAISLLVKRLYWHYEIPKDNRLYEHAEFERLYDRLRHQKFLRELGVDEEP